MDGDGADLAALHYDEFKKKDDTDQILECESCRFLSFSFYSFIAPILILNSFLQLSLSRFIINNDLTDLYYCSSLLLLRTVQTPECLSSPPLVKQISLLSTVPPLY